MSKQGYESFPGGNLSFSLQIDENKLNERFKWILTMFGYFEGRMKSFEDRLSLSSFQTSVNPIIFERTFQKVSKETMNKMHEERENVYRELYNGLSKDITEKFTTAVLLEQEKRLEETRVLILGNITASAKSLERISEEGNRTKHKLNNLIRVIQEHERIIKANDEKQKTKEIFISEVSIQTVEFPETKPANTHNFQNPNNLDINSILEQKIKTVALQIKQRADYDMQLINKRFSNLQQVISSQSEKLKQLFEESSQQQYSIQKHPGLQHQNLSVVNRSLSPSIRKRSQLLEKYQSCEDIELFRKQIDILKQNQMTMFENRANELNRLRQKIILIEQKLARDSKDPEQQKWLQQKVENHLMELLSTPFQQKFSKKLNDGINKRLLDIKFELMSYMKQIDKKVEGRVSTLQMKQLQREMEEKIAFIRHIVEKKMSQDGGVYEKIREVEERVTLSAKKQVKTEQSLTKQICLSCREPKTEFVKRRTSSSRRLPAKTLSQSFSINSYAKRFF